MTTTSITTAPPAPGTPQRLELTPPAFSDVAQERHHRKERLAAALRLFAYFGYEEGVAGHITVRDPEHPDRFWVNPMGMPFGHVRVSDLILLDDRGEVVEGFYGTHPAPFSIHSALYRARPDIQCAAHSHSTYGKAVAALGRPVEPITQDACAFYEDQGYFDDYTGVVLDEAEGKRLAGALAGHKALILRNHGLITVGGSVDAATWWFIALERACEVQLLARAAGEPLAIEHENALRTREQVGSDFMGWLNFQPLYEQIVRLQPDLLD
ncbi:class II aldolase/adducin family protein [Streptomyces sp. NPDC006476]|uniref:class II aldolase/adducin family protein n=1 Tax=Streptomyces sp. NPDC006476 TaxID=3157175 RepID=UPI0033B43924